MKTYHRTDLGRFPLMNLKDTELKQFHNFVSGHYEFDMSLEHHQHLVGRLRDLANSEAPSPTWRNILHQHLTSLKIPICKGCPAQFKGVPPRHGILSFDYVSFAPLPCNATVLSDDALDEVVSKVFNDACAVGNMLEAAGTTSSSFGRALMKRQGSFDKYSRLQTEAISNLRRMSCWFFVTAMQAKKIVQRFKVGKLYAATYAKIRINDIDGSF